jgi:hypothetical protein
MPAPEQRTCAWMSGPRETAVPIPAIKWWLAISRDVFAKGFRSQRMATRTPALCYRTPTFTSPLAKR